MNNLLHPLSPLHPHPHNIHENAQDTIQTLSQCLGDAWCSSELVIILAVIILIFVFPEVFCLLVAICHSLLLHFGKRSSNEETGHQRNR